MSTRLIGGLLLAPPNLVFADTGNAPQPIDLTHHWVGYFSLAVIVLAYIGAMLEEETFLRKSKSMLLSAALIWFVIVLSYRQQGDVRLAVEAFQSNLSAYMELLLFIMVSMTYLNAMEDMRVFLALRNWLVGARFGAGYRPVGLDQGEIFIQRPPEMVPGHPTGLFCRDRRPFPGQFPLFLMARPRSLMAAAGRGQT